jgi:hypothetical protein
MKQGRKCAYCDASGELTKEHLLPRSLTLRSDEELKQNIMARGEHRVISSEATIADVCAACNNGPLSLLDQYICSLYDKYFAQVVQPGNRVKFEADFELLLRWLLKTAYNHARARRGNWPVSLLQAERDYILGKVKKRPTSHIILQLIPPARIEPGSIKGLPPDATESPMLFTRVGLFDFTFAPGFLMGFLIAVKSYCFHVLVEDARVDMRLRKRVFASLLKDTPGGYELVPGKRAVVYPSSLDMFQVALKSSPLVRNMRNWDNWQK